MDKWSAKHRCQYRGLQALKEPYYLPVKKFIGDSAWWTLCWKPVLAVRDWSKKFISRNLECTALDVHGGLLTPVAFRYTAAWPLPLQAPPTSGGGLHDSVVCRHLHLLGVHTGNDPLHVMNLDPELMFIFG